mgnify:CR=1 FL=1
MKFELSLSTLVTIIFVILKLCGVLSWSWLWVLSPLWGGVAIIIVVAVLVWLFGCIAVIIEEKREKKNR